MVWDFIEILKKEIVLEVPELPIDAVYALGGYSSSRLEIARIYYGQNPSSEQLEEFDELLKLSNQELGPRWVVEDMKDRVIDKMLIAVEKLRPYHPDYSKKFKSQ